ncbi:IS3 family transposase [[Acholeplasma] multilocale]|uniref:IS3 family transposase n=1 Tax=[Acholeplasma] multilocale TaxID=264638 RepID=UPI0006860EB9|nr:IS3 family transposase [[Acholeplasma] multilocale]
MPVSKYNKTFKIKIAKLHLDKKLSMRFISEKYNIPISTVWGYVDKYKKGIFDDGNGLRKKKNLFPDEKYRLLKMNYDYLKKTNKEKLIYIKYIYENDKTNLSISELLDTFDIKKSYWDKYKNLDYKKDDLELLILIKKIFEDSLNQFGYRRITEELKTKYNINVNHKKVYRIMKENEIISNYVIKAKKSSRYSKASKESKGKFPDLVLRKFSSSEERFKLLFTDVTYLILNGKKMYQSSIMDSYSKNIIDYKISERNDIKLVMDNLKSAVKKIKNKGYSVEGMIIHSDRGYQYTSNEYEIFNQKNGILISMGKSGVCADNLVIEQFHSELKKGTIHNNKFETMEEYILFVHKWMKWYMKYKDKKFELSNKNKNSPRNKFVSKEYDQKTFFELINNLNVEDYLWQNK